MFCQKPIVSNVISAFLDYLKPKFFSPANHGRRHRAPCLFKISGSAPVRCSTLTRTALEQSVKYVQS